MEDEGSGPPRAESLLPYDLWTEEALRQVVGMAVAYASANGLPGEHHFFISFRTDAAGVVVPARLREKYPQEMTIVLQHQFWELKLVEGGQAFSVGLSFGGVPATLVVPLSAVTGFADPHVQFGLRFRPPESAEEEADAGSEAAAETVSEVPTAEEETAPAEKATPQVVSLDAFRRRTPGKEG